MHVHAGGVQTREVPAWHYTNLLKMSPFGPKEPSQAPTIPDAAEDKSSVSTWILPPSAALPSLLWDIFRFSPQIHEIVFTLCSHSEIPFKLLIQGALDIAVSIVTETPKKQNDLLFGTNQLSSKRGLMGALDPALISLSTLWLILLNRWLSTKGICLLEEMCSAKLEKARPNSNDGWNTCLWLVFWRAKTFELRRWFLV